MIAPDAPSGPLRHVVLIRGEQDIATSGELIAAIRLAIGRDDADVVLDLSGVPFMDASTVGALVDAHNVLRGQARSLTVAGPSAPARHILELCGLEHLIHAAEAEPSVGVESADELARSGP
jgi:anti-anti-sigma factor